MATNRFLKVGTQCLSFDQFEQCGNKVANGLAKLGVKEGDVVSVLMRNRMAYMEVIHACKRLGIYYCPINWHFTPEEVNFIVRDNGSKYVFTESAFLKDIIGILPDDLHYFCVSSDSELSDSDAVKSIQHPYPESISAFDVWRDAQDIYQGPITSPRGHMAYTSGTTGRPKGVVRFPIPLDELPARQPAMQEVAKLALGIQQGSRALLTAPFYHSAPSIFTQTALRLCDQYIVMDRFDAEEVLKHIDQYKINVVYLVPIMYVRLLKLPQAVREKYDLTSLEFVASTGAPCPPEIKRQMIDWFGPVIHETYASSEAGMITSINSIEALKKPGSAGKPMGAGVIHIRDENGQLCPPLKPGKIYVRQPAYADFTYRNNPEARKKIEMESLVTLGDIGYLDEEGYLFVCDRESDMVISGGVNIYPAEIENVILTHPGVADCAVVGVPDAEYGEKLFGFVQPNGTVNMTSESLIDWLKPKAAGYKIPRDFKFQENLPRDDSGKIIKRRLRDPFWANQARKV